MSNEIIIESISKYVEMVCELNSKINEPTEEEKLKKSGESSSKSSKRTWCFPCNSMG